MKSVSHWINSISCACVICSLIEYILPRGHVSRTLRYILDIFTLSVMFLPLTKSNFSLNAQNFLEYIKKNQENFGAQSARMKKINSKIETNASESVERIVRKFLFDIGVKARKIVISFNKNPDQDNVITEINCKIYVSKNDFFRAEEIKRKIWDNLKICAEVVTHDGK